MKKLVFLHGAGANCMAHHTLVQDVARLLHAEIILFNAPFAHQTKPDGFVWFNKITQNGIKTIVTENYFTTLRYIKEKLLALHTDLNDIILMGHSQGGGMAAHIGLELNLGAVISISGDTPYTIPYKNSAHK